MSKVEIISEVLPLITLKMEINHSNGTSSKMYIVVNIYLAHIHIHKSTWTTLSKLSKLLNMKMGKELVERKLGWG